MLPHLALQASVLISFAIEADSKLIGKG